MPGIVSFQSRRHGPVQDMVFICLACRRKSGVKRFGRFFSVFDHDVRRQQAVESPLNLLRSQPRPGIKIGYLPPGVDSRIGPARGSNPHGVSQHDFKAGFDDFLYGKNPVLPLPPMVPASIVLQNELKIPSYLNIVPVHVSPAADPAARKNPAFMGPAQSRRSSSNRVPENAVHGNWIQAVDHGCQGGSLSPASSGRPLIRFILQTA